MGTRIEDLASSYLQNVKPTGSDNLRALCPLCSSNRSFIISTRHGAWHCFSCKEGGGVATLLAKLGMSRRAIDKWVSGLDLSPILSPRLRRKRLLDHKGSTLPEYILGAYESCPIQLLDAGFDMDLLFENDVGYDNENDRVTYAIRDYLGRLVAISGRATEDWRIPRYKVYDADPPDDLRKPGELYHIVAGYKPENRDHLYGFHQVYPQRFFDPDNVTLPLIVVEGFKGRLWLVQQGFSDTVALMGDFLSASQNRLLSKVRGPYYIMLDNEPGKTFPNDEGYCQAYKIASRLSRSGTTFICSYEESKPVGTSPDDLTRQEIESMVRAAKTTPQLKRERNRHHVQKSFSERNP